MERLVVPLARDLGKACTDAKVAFTQVPLEDVVAPPIVQLRESRTLDNCLATAHVLESKTLFCESDATCSQNLLAPVFSPLTKQRQTKKAPTHHSPSRLFQSERLPAVTLTGTKSRASCTLIIFSADGFWREPPCEPYRRPPVSSLHRSTIPGIGIGRRHRNLKFQNCLVELFLLLQISWPRRRC